MIAIILRTFKFYFSFFAVFWKIQRPWAMTNNMHGPVQNRSETPQHLSLCLGALQNIRFWRSPEAAWAEKRRRASVAGQSFSAAHVTEQNMPWSFVLSRCIVGNLPEFSSSSLTQLAQQLLVFALLQILTESGFKSRPVWKEGVKYL